MAGVHSRAIRNAGGRLALLASSSARSAATAAEAFGVDRAAEYTQEVFEDDTVDVVHICTPNSTHEALALAAISAGKHVVCEKPLGIDGPSAHRIAAAARSAGVVATVPFVYRFHPMVRQAKFLIGSDEIGPVTAVSASYLQDWLLDPEAGNWRVQSAAGGPSRAFADIGSHLLDLVEFTTADRIVELVSATRTVHQSRAGIPVDTEDLAAIIFRLGRGGMGTAAVSQVAAGHANDLRLEISGTTGSIAFAQETPDMLTVGRAGRRETLIRGIDAMSADAKRLSMVPAGHPMGYQDAFNGFVADTYDTIRGREMSGLPTFEDGARSNLLTDLVLESARTHAWVAVP